MKSEPSPNQQHRNKTGGASIHGRIALAAVVFLLVGLRGAAEIGMMREHGPDPQMGIWIAFMAVRMAAWLVGGLGAVCVLFLSASRRWVAIGGSILLAIWVFEICGASWQYNQGRQALADATDPATGTERLCALSDFNGIQTGYELDNRVASHPNTSAATLRKLYGRGQFGTELILARNSNTPSDILLELSKSKDQLIQQSLAENPSFAKATQRQ